VFVNRGDKDNATFMLFNHGFSFSINEIMIKRRTKLLSSKENTLHTEFKPMYEKLYSGLLEIDFTEILDNRTREREAKRLHFQDSENEPLEKQLGKIFISLFRISNEATIARYISERELEKRRKEEQRLREIEAEKLREQQRIEAKNQRRIKFHQNIDRHIEEWFKYQDLKKYINDLNELLQTMVDPESKEIIEEYLLLLKEKTDKANPINNIISEIKSLKDD
jgi:DNA polymerase II small subunit/DNA polymerase delta subunit B